MAGTNDDLERQKLLEEIRKRAEQAELARIDAEVAKLTTGFVPSLPEATEVHRAARAPLTEPQTPPPSFGDILPLYSTPPLATGATAAREQARESLPKAKPNDPQRIATLLIAANADYQQEKYDRALQTLEELLALDEENTEALTLRSDVEKAKMLSERLREEEERRKAAAADNQKPSIPEPPRSESAVNAGFGIVDEKVVSVEPAGEAEPSPVHRPRVRRLVVLGGLATLAVLGIVTAIVVYRTLRSEFAAPATSILILPPATPTFDESIREGLMDDLITHLSHVQELKAFSSGTASRASGADPLAAARALSSAYVLQWTVSNQQNMAAVHLTLYEAASSSIILDKELSKPLERFGTLANDVAGEIAEALDAESSSMNVPFRSVAANMNSYRAFLLGNYLLNHPRQASLDSVAANFTLSCRSDPSFPYAFAALGWTNILRHEAAGESSHVYLDQAVENLQRAINLRGNSSTIYRLWAATEYYRGNYQYALNRLEYAVKIAPSDAESHRRLALVYLRMGRNPEALEVARYAVDADPLGESSRTMLGLALLLNNAPKSAVAEFEAAQRLQPDSARTSSDAYLAALVGANQHERALDILRERVRRTPSDFVAYYDLGRMYQLAGKPRSEWEQALTTALQRIEDTLKTQPRFALAHSYRGLSQTRLGFFAEAAEANRQALELAPQDPAILYNAARLYALQNKRLTDAKMYLIKAVRRTFSLDRLIELDLQNLRNAAGFAKALTE
jgi:tetratricopeptide (TPR) repeat protein